MELRGQEGAKGPYQGSCLASMEFFFFWNRGAEIEKMKWRGLFAKESCRLKLIKG